MYAKLFNVMRMQASLASNAISQMRIGTISSYDPATYSVKVLLKPDDTESEWLPLLTPMSGNSWGIYAPPQLGDCAVIGYQEGDKESGFIIGHFFNDVDRPESVESGEIQIINKIGTKIILKKNGDIEINCSTQNITATCTEFTINGKLHVTGDINSDAQVIDYKSSMDGMRTIYNSHTHPDPQGGNTSPPNQPM
jgi:phage baseplate assembly protein V